MLSGNHAEFHSQLRAQTLWLMQMEELACYLPGNLALGVAEGAVAGEKAVQYAAIAEELTHTCKRMYSLMPAGEPCLPCTEPMFQDPDLQKSALNVIAPEIRSRGMIIEG